MKSNFYFNKITGVYMSNLSQEEILAAIKHGLIASCQPVDDGPMDHPEIVAAMAQASVIGGAAGLRIEGIDNLKATRPTVKVPIIGIVKRDLPDSPVRITPFLDDVDRKSTRLNSSHVSISYAVFCLK